MRGSSSDDLFARLLAREPARRHASASELRRALMMFRGDGVTSAIERLAALEDAPKAPTASTRAERLVMRTTGISGESVSRPPKPGLSSRTFMLLVASGVLVIGAGLAAFTLGSRDDGAGTRANGPSQPAGRVASAAQPSRASPSHPPEPQSRHPAAARLTASRAHL